jgi:hypothetical protein
MIAFSAWPEFGCGYGFISGGGDGLGMIGHIDGNGYGNGFIGLNYGNGFGCGRRIGTGRSTGDGIGQGEERFMHSVYRPNLYQELIDELSLVVFLQNNR